MSHFWTGSAVLVLAATAAVAVAGDDLSARFTERLRTVIPDARVTAVESTPVPGLYEVALGPKILYMSTDGRYLFSGDLMDLGERRNISEERREQARVAAFVASGVDKMIQFGPDNARHVVYVFTDIDCAYCRRMHQEVGKLNAAGIAVRYLAFPRHGLQSESYHKAVSVWCAKDRQQALTDAKAGKPIAEATCNNPVEEQFTLGEAMGVRGTPAVYLDDGVQLGGYVPADELIQILNGKS